MALTRLVIDGYGQIELNNFAAPRDGRVEAQCKLNKTDFPAGAENGMLVAVDNVKREVKLYNASKKLPLAVIYSTEHIYSERKNGLKNFINTVIYLLEINLLPIRSAMILLNLRQRPIL